VATVASPALQDKDGIEAIVASRASIEGMTAKFIELSPFEAGRIHRFNYWTGESSFFFRTGYKKLRAER
jgi:hypothetical protein